MHRLALSLVAIAVALAAPAQAAATADAWGSPERVTIDGYSDDAMEPFISCDGQYLFFNNSNDAKKNPNTDLFYATRVDDLNFKFQGALNGVNSPALDAVASMDRNNNFFFITTRSYADIGTPGFLATIYSGPFSNGSVATVKPVAGITAERPGLVIFDEEISADGNTLYYTQGDFSANKGIPEHTRMLIAHRNGSSFVPDPNSGRIMKEIDAEGLLNYAADISASELEFFFTRIETLRKGPEILMATRASTSEPFGHPEKIGTIKGFAEAPSISPNAKALYYHFRSESGTFVINRVTRP